MLQKIINHQVFLQHLWYDLSVGSQSAIKISFLAKKSGAALKQFTSVESVLRRTWESKIIKLTAAQYFIFVIFANQPWT